MYRENINLQSIDGKNQINLLQKYEFHKGHEAKIMPFYISNFNNDGIA